MTDLAAFWVRFRTNRPAVAGLAVLAVVLVMAAIGPTLYPTDPFDMVGRPFLPPFGAYPLGTDVAGRDILAGILHGARISLMIGIMASFGATVFGVAVGAVAGYYGGWLDNLLMRLTDFFLTIPSFVLAVVLVAIFSPDIVTIVLAIATVSWPSVARLARGEFIAHRQREYVLGCRALGMRDREIILFQIMPNALPPVVVVGSLTVATAILTESGLSFLGLGDPNLVSWGYMIGVARTVLRSAWWMAAIPGLMILITVLAINLVGEGLNDALNPRLRQR
ncbi:MAG: ABC transporter permease [Azospirillum sp.]|nr:ABC transporter permease [Azospirillum sp.]